VPIHPVLDTALARVEVDPCHGNLFKDLGALAPGMLQQNMVEAVSLDVQGSSAVAKILKGQLANDSVPDLRSAGLFDKAVRLDLFAHLGQIAILPEMWDQTFTHNVAGVLGFLQKDHIVALLA